MNRILLSFILPLTLAGTEISPVFANNDESDSESEVEDDSDFRQGRGDGPDNHDSEYSKDVRIREPILRGSGCKAGTHAAVLSPDNKTLSVLFDQYISEAGATVDKKRDVKNCNLTIPFEVPNGFQVSVVKIDYRGYVDIPPNAEGRFIARYRFTDSKSNRKYGRKFVRRKIFRGPKDKDFLIHTGLGRRRGIRLWSRCGKDVNLHIDTRLATITNPRMDDVLATIDSIDATENNVRYHLKWRKCKKGRHGRGGIRRKRGPRHGGVRHIRWRAKRIR